MINRFSNLRIKRGLTAFLLGKVVSGLAGLLAMVLVVRGLSVPEFAAYSVLFALVEVFTAISGLGLAHVILRYVPELYATHRPASLRALLRAAIGTRTFVLVACLLFAYAMSSSLTPLLNLDEVLPAFQMFLLVVALRSSLHFLSQVLESTLHQQISQFAFSLSAIGRCVGMFWLLSLGSVNLIDVIVLEALCDGVACIVLVIGIFTVLHRATSDGSSQADDTSWWSAHRKMIVRFAGAAYLQHLATLPYGSNTNRLVGGAMFGDMVMATFGFAQSLYEYFKRYMPTQMLIGLIRPVVVSRYVSSRDFGAAAKLCDQALQINLILLFGTISVLLVAGAEALSLLSAGKYGADAVWLLVALLALLCFETQRLVLELLTQTVEKYAILIPSNLFLSASVLLGIAAYPIAGSLSFPLANMLAIVWANAWVISRLRRLGHSYQHDWHDTCLTLLLTGVSTIAGLSLKQLTMNWVLAAVITIGVYIALFFKYRLSESLAFVRALVGKVDRDDHL